MANLVSDLITEAFLDLGEITPGRTISTAEQTDAFLRLNQMLAQWSREQLTVYTVVHGVFTMVAGTTLYTLGTGGSLVTASIPVRVSGASSVSGNFRKSMRVMSFDRFAQEFSDELGSASVLAEAVAADNAYPAINLRVYPVPAPSPGSLLLDYWTAIAAFATVGDSVALPFGFEEAIHYNLAVRLYPVYAGPGTPPLTAIEALAANSKAAIAALNAQVLSASTQAESPGPQQKAA